MYQRLNACISDFSHEGNSEDYWYDCAILEANGLLKGFDESDWEALLNDLNEKSILWQRRLVECLGNSHDVYELEVVLALIDTKDENLFVACIDSLRSIDLSKLNQGTKELLLMKSNLLLARASSPIENMLNNFIKKL